MNKNLRKMVESAVMIALATVLSLITVLKMPQGGSVTAASMLPIVLIAFRYGPCQGLLTAFVYSLIQMMLGFYAPPVNTVFNYALVVLLDYIFAFSVLGLAPLFGRVFKNKIKSVIFGTVCVMILRLTCHFLSGIIIWSSYAPAGQPVWLYSIIYNGSYMAVETVVTVVLAAVIVPFIRDKHTLLSA